MASNSDSIYYVLTKLKHHPELIKSIRPRYTNTVMVLFDDSLKKADASFYFHVDSFIVAKNGDLLDSYFSMTNGTKKNYHDVWATTCHIPEEKVYLLELSFE